MDPQRKSWNERQQALRQALSRPETHKQAIELFMRQHAMLHAAELTPDQLYSFADEVWQGLDERAARCIPPRGEHSIVWVIWHLARIEDVTMNMLVAGGPQVLCQEDWLERLQVTEVDTGNAMDAGRIAQLSATVDIAALRAYRLAVGKRTRQIVARLQAQELKYKVQQARLQQVLQAGAVEAAAHGLIDYWGGLTVAGLLLMPPTRHIFVHLNEALRLKEKCQKLFKSSGN